MTGRENHGMGASAVNRPGGRARRFLQRPAAARSARGVTLIELILVLVILSILASVAAPNLSGFTDGTEVQSVKNKLISDLRSARARAMACSGATLEVDLGSWERRWAPEGEGCGNLPDLTRKDGVTVSSDPAKFRFRYPHGDLEDGSGNGLPGEFTIDLTKGDVTRALCVRAATGGVSRGACK